MSLSVSNLFVILTLSGEIQRQKLHLINHSVTESLSASDDDGRCGSFLNNDQECESMDSGYEGSQMYVAGCSFTEVIITGVMQVKTRL